MEPTNIGRPRDDRIDRAVLAATLELLAEGSYAELTLTAVAARAGTSVPAVRRRWPSKLHLVHSAVFPEEAAIPPRRAGMSIRDEMASVVDNCALMMSHASILGAMTGLISDLSADPDLLAELTDRLGRVVWDDLGERFAAAARNDGVEVRIDVGLVAEVAFGAALMAAVVRGHDGLDERWRADLTDLLVAGLGVAPQSAGPAPVGASPGAANTVRTIE